MEFAKKAKDATKRGRDAGLIGLFTVLAQLFIGHKSETNLTEEFEKLRGQITELKLERNYLYVRKEDMSKELQKLTISQYQLKEDVVYVSHQVIDLKNLIKKMHHLPASYAMGDQSCYEKASLKLPTKNIGNKQIQSKTLSVWEFNI
jgi:hypothetical protein